MKQQIDIPEEETLDDEDDFGGPDPSEKKPFWKGELLFGYSLPWLLGVSLLALASCWYLFGPSLSFTSNTPSDSSFSEVENTLDNTPHSMTTPAARETTASPNALAAAQSAPTVVQSDTTTMMTDIRDELNDRDRKLNDSLTALKDSVTRLSDAIKRDETYALETRNQLTELTRKLALLETRAPAAQVTRPAATTATAKRQPASAVSGMKIMSLESGMAWIKWQGSTWSVREGDTLGKVTVRQIDPVTRSVVTTGGTLR